MYLDTFNELTSLLSRENSTEEIKQQAICKAIRSAIPQANRITLWKFINDKTAIVCLTHLQADNEGEAVGMQLHKSDYPDYFEAILNEQMVIASEARTHATVQHFTESYFKPNNIYSLLDYNFQTDFSPIGVICCESVGTTARWSEQDINNLKRIARITSMFY